MSDETAVARRENNVITRQEENSTTEKNFLVSLTKYLLVAKLRQNSNTVMKYSGKNSTEQESE